MIELVAENSALCIRLSIVEKLIAAMIDLQEFGYYMGPGEYPPTLDEKAILDRIRHAR